MADLFEKNLGSATSGEAKPTKRRNTRMLEGTMLCKQNAIVVRVFNMRQNIDKSFKGMLVTNSKISMDLHSLPYGWNVTRTHEDF